MDFLTNIVYTLLAYSPELLLTYVIVAAIIGMIKRVRRGLRDDGSFIRLLASRLDGNGQKDDDDELARDPYTAVNLLNGYTQGVTPTLDADAAPLPPESLRTPAPLPPGFVRLDQEATPTAGVLDATLSAPSQPSSLPPTNAKHVTAITLGRHAAQSAKRIPCRRRRGDRRHRRHFDRPRHYYDVGPCCRLALRRVRHR